MKRVLLSMVVLAGLALTTVSCGKAKEAAKNGIEATKDAANKTAEAAKDAAHATGDAVKDAANATGDAVKGAADVAKNALTGKAADGKKLFASKGCVACHKEATKLVGPAIKDIAKVYADKKGNMVKFLKGNADAIVDTDPGQVAVMKANITGMLKDFSAEELQAVAAYMRSVK